MLGKTGLACLVIGTALNAGGAYYAGEGIEVFLDHPRTIPPTKPTQEQYSAGEKFMLGGRMLLFGLPITALGAVCLYLRQHHPYEHRQQKNLPSRYKGAPRDPPRVTYSLDPKQTS